MAETLQLRAAPVYNAVVRALIILFLVFAVSSVSLVAWLLFGFATGWRAWP